MYVFPGFSECQNRESPVKSTGVDFLYLPYSSLFQALKPASLRCWCRLFWGKVFFTLLQTP
jgi:hypothetical protein